MSRDLHTVSMLSGSALAYEDRALAGFFPQLAYVAGNGDPSAIAAGSPGVGYQTIPTVAFANAGSGSGATATALMGLVAPPTITAGGTGGTPGAVTLTGTDGTGTKFQCTGVINGGGVLTSITAVTVPGSYSALPGTLTAGAVSGGSLSGCTLNLSAAMGVVGYSAIGGSSNHQYAQGTTAALTGGTPSTPAVPGAVTITSVAGQGSKLSIAQTLPATYSVQIGDLGQDAIGYVTNRTQAGFTLNINPRLAASTLVAGTVDLTIFA